MLIILQHYLGEYTVYIHVTNAISIAITISITISICISIDISISILFLLFGLDMYGLLFIYFTLIIIHARAFLFVSYYIDITTTVNITIIITIVNISIVSCIRIRLFLLDE